MNKILTTDYVQSIDGSLDYTTPFKSVFTYHAYGFEYDQLIISDNILHRIFVMIMHHYLHHQHQYHHYFLLPLFAKNQGKFSPRRNGDKLS